MTNTPTSPQSLEDYLAVNLRAQTKSHVVGELYLLQLELSGQLEVVKTLLKDRSFTYKKVAIALIWQSDASKKYRVIGKATKEADVVRAAAQAPVRTPPQESVPKKAISKPVASTSGGKSYLTDVSDSSSSDTDCDDTTPQNCSPPSMPILTLPSPSTSKQQPQPQQKPKLTTTFVIAEETPSTSGTTVAIPATLPIPGFATQPDPRKNKRPANEVWNSYKTDYDGRNPSQRT